MNKVVIIGGGINGVATAYHLARTGMTVRVIEKQHLGSMASGWTLGGVRQSGRHDAELPLALSAVEEWQDLSTQLNADTGYVQSGNMRLARSDAQAAFINSMVASQKAKGLSLDILSGEDARRHAPALSEKIVLASLCKSDGFANPLATVNAYAQAAKQYGAEIVEQCTAFAITTRNGKVTGVETNSGHFAADYVVVTAGTHTPALLKPLGLHLPLSVQCVRVNETGPIPFLFPHVFGVAEANCAGRQDQAGRFRYTTGIGPYNGDSENWTTESLKPSSAEIHALRELASGFLPVLADIEPEHAWGGLIDLTPDALPVMDRSSSHEGLIIGAGFSGHGFGIAPSGDPISHDIKPFAIDRFSALNHEQKAVLSLNG
jgi:sarcosine oxidase subunit beta